MFVGRMSPDKGVHHAVRVAKKAGMRLVLSTKMREDNEIAYFESEIKPLLDPGDEMPAEIPQDAPSRVAARRRRDAQPDYLARALRPGHGGGTGVRHACARLPERRCAGDH